MAAIARFFVCSNLPPQTIDGHQFIELLHLCNPLITRSLLFTPNTLTQFIHQKALLAKQALKLRLAKISPPTLSFSCSRSTPADRNHSLLGLVVHWLAPDHKPALRSVPLGLLQLSRKPSPRNIAQAILKILADYDLQHRIFSLTIDHVPDLHHFGRILATLIPGFKPESQLIGCMGSLINRSAELLLRDLFPTIISRLQNLTLLLRQSPQKSDSFARIVAAVTSSDSQPPGLLTPANTSRWNATYLVLARAYQLKEAIQIFCLKEVGFAQFLILDQEWDIVRQLCDFLKPMNTAANEISSDKPCDMITATPTFCWLLRRLNKVRRNYEGRELLEPVKEMLDRLSSSATPGRIAEIQKAFYESSRPYSLYPTFRTHGQGGSDVIVDPSAPAPASSDRLEIDHPHPQQQQPQSGHHMTKRPRDNDDYRPQNDPDDSDSDSDYSSGKPRIFKKKPKLMIGLKDEIANYLEVECEESTCVPLEYWSAHRAKFPSLSLMSKDFLAVQASAGMAFASCERLGQVLEAFLAGPSLEAPGEPSSSADAAASHARDSPAVRPPSSSPAPYPTAAPADPRPLRIHHPPAGFLQLSGPGVEHDIIVSARPASSDAPSIPVHLPHPDASPAPSAPHQAQEIDPSLQHHAGPTLGPPATDAPAAAAAVLALDAFGSPQTHFDACLDIVCLYYWAFAHGFVDL
ncbi:hypothetical protein PtB15_18B299 [Puccinia triticina]|nr:hypothetical protein PtB15_18B299 [Puccinia triticina]